MRDVGMHDFRPLNNWNLASITTSLPLPNKPAPGATPVTSTGTICFADSDRWDKACPVQKGPNSEYWILED